MSLLPFLEELLYTIPIIDGDEYTELPFMPDSDSEEEDDSLYTYSQEDIDYNYSQPLKYADVFRFA